MQFKNVNSEYIICSNGDMFRIDGNLKLKHYHKDGYPVYSYYDNGKVVTRRVKIIVALAFIDNPMNFKFVVNIDKDRCNNDVSNLKWSHSVDDSFKMNNDGRECTRCRKFKSYDNFPKRNNRSIGVQSVCTKCVVISNSIRKGNNPDKYRDLHYKKKYKSSIKEFMDILDSQGGMCAICKTYQHKMCMDHCHETMKIRGILCDRCNRGIGLLKDDPNVLLSAYDYLIKHKQQ